LAVGNQGACGFPEAFCKMHMCPTILFDQHKVAMYSYLNIWGFWNTMSRHVQSEKDNDIKMVVLISLSKTDLEAVILGWVVSQCLADQLILC